MAIGSIDLQVLIPRATDASKVQQLSNNQPTLQQQQLAEQQQQLDVRQLKQVQNTEKTTNKKIKEKDPRENQHSDNEPDEAFSDDHDKAEKDNPSTPPDPARGHLIDIKT